MTKHTFLSAVVLLAFGASTPAQVPHTFSPGTPARASEVNANFAALSEQLAGKVDAFSVLGHGAEPGVVPEFLFFAPTATITVTSPSQKFLVLSMKVFGTAQPGGSGWYSVNICYRDTRGASMQFAIASPTNPFPDWTPYINLPPGVFIPINLSAVLASLAPGTYEVGLCGAPVGWPAPTVNPWLWNAGGAHGYTNVVVLN